MSICLASMIFINICLVVIDCRFSMLIEASRTVLLCVVLNCAATLCAFLQWLLGRFAPSVCVFLRWLKCSCSGFLGCSASAMI